MNFLHRLLLSVLVLSGFSLGQGSQFPLSPVTDVYGNAIVGAQIYVCQPNASQVPCLSQEATIYTDYTLGHVLAQPVVSDGSGNFTFGCTNAYYLIQVVAQGSTYSYKASCPSQTTGTITGITTASGSGLIGGGTSGNLSLSLLQSCTSNQVLIWNGSSWICGTNGTVTGATANGGLLLTGTTLGLLTSCSNNQILQWNGSAWVCGSAGAGTLTGATANGGLLVTGTTLGLITSCSNNQILQWNTTAWACANAGSGTVTGATANGGLVSTGTTLGLIKTCSDGQVLSWVNGTSTWTCTNNGTGTITGATSGGGLVASSTTLGLITSCSNGQGLTWNGSSWVCTNLATGAVLLNPVGSQTVTQSVGNVFQILNGSFQVTGSGNVNGFTGLDSTTNAQANATSNTWQFASGTPLALTSSAAPPSGGAFWPIWVANISGVQYSSAFELRGNLDDASGYPSLCSSTSQCVTPSNGNTSTGIVPLSEIVTNTSGCNSSSYILGDQSGCGSTTSSVAFSAVTSATNVNTLVIGNGGSLTTSGLGVINATKLNSGSFPPAGSYNLHAVFMTSNVTGPNVTTVSVPNCQAFNSALQFQTSSNSWQCGSFSTFNSSVGTIQCNSTGGTCPNTTSVTVQSNTYVVNSLAVPGNLVPANHCISIKMFFKHTTDGGTPRSTMSWNITSTAPAGTYPTQTVSGGTTMAGNSLVAGTSGSFMMPLTVCNYNSFTNTQYLFQEQAQFSGSTIGGAVSSSTIDTTNTFYINLLATNTSGNADVFDFNGGEWRLE